MLPEVPDELKNLFPVGKVELEARLIPRADASFGGRYGFPSFACRGIPYAIGFTSFPSFSRYSVGVTPTISRKTCVK